MTLRHYLVLLSLLALALAVAPLGCSTPPGGGGDAAATGPATAAEPATPRAVVEAYAKVVLDTYTAALKDAVAMKLAIQTFLEKPTPEHFAAARAAWVRARWSYGQTEAFRSYGGPVDGIGEEAGWAVGVEGPEARLNAWPVNEAGIDYVRGPGGERLERGIINDSDVPITQSLLVDRNQAGDEADVTMGYHAIEFLLWGQDFDDDGPGDRPVTDYRGDRGAERRGEYLRVVTEVVIEDLESLVAAWEPGRDNYRSQFLAQPPERSLGQILTGLATLSGFELASERIGVGLDSGDQEDEQSCFSDTTNLDYMADLQGVAEVYFGREIMRVVPDGRMSLRDAIRHWRSAEGTRPPASLASLVRHRDKELADRLEAALFEADALADTIPHPVDRILASDPGSPGRERMEALAESLYQLAELFKEAGEALGVEVQIAGE